MANRVTELPDYYKKGKESNNYKILELASRSEMDISQELDEIRAASCIETAAGYALDMWGQSYGVLRKGESDDLYRARIQTTLLQDRVYTDYTSWRSALLQMIGCSTEDLNIAVNAKRQEIQVDTDIGYYEYTNSIKDSIQHIAPLTALVLVGYIRNGWDAVQERTWGTVNRVTWWNVYTDKRFRQGGTI